MGVIGALLSRLGPLLGILPRAASTSTAVARRAAQFIPPSARGPAGTLVRRGTAIAGAGAAFELGSRAFPGGASFPGGDIPIQGFGGGGRGAFGGGAGGLGIPQPGDQFGTTFVLRTWTTNPATGFPIFAKLADGRIVVTKKDGSLKTYRPKKPIVISTNPRIRQVARAARTLDRATASMIKVRKQTQRAVARVK